MATYWWSAENYAVNDVPSEWIIERDISSMSIQLDAQGNKYLSVVSNNGTDSIMVFAPDGITPLEALDVDYFVSTEIGPTIADFNAILRGSALTGNALTFYGSDLGLSGGNTTNRIYRLAGGGYQLLAGYNFPKSMDTRYNLRFRANGTQKKSKAWASADLEPELWNPGVEIDETNINTAGRIGVAYWKTSANARLYAVGIGTNGDPAPTSAPAPTIATPINLGTTNLLATSVRLTWGRG